MGGTHISFVTTTYASSRVADSKYCLITINLVLAMCGGPGIVAILNVQ